MLHMKECLTEPIAVGIQKYRYLRVMRRFHGVYLDSETPGDPWGPVSVLLWGDVVALGNMERHRHFWKSTYVMV